MSFFPYLILIYDISHAILSFISLILSFYGLKQQRISAKKFTTNFSPILTIYFLFMFIYSLSWLLYAVFLLTFWRPTINIYNTQIMYILGSSYACLIHVVSIMEAFLAIERCLTIIFPIKYTPKLQRLFNIFVVFMLGLTLGIVIWISDTIKVYPSFLVTECLYFDCLAIGVKRKYTYETKVRFQKDFNGGKIKSLSEMRTLKNYFLMDVKMGFNGSEFC